MGKKHNKKKNNFYDYIDMSPEEQKAGAIRLDEYENGEISFLEAIGYKESEAPRNKSNLNKQIEAAYINRVKEEGKLQNNRNNSYNDYNNDRYMEEDDDNVDNNQVYDNDDNEPEYEEEKHEEVNSNNTDENTTSNQNSSGTEIIHHIPQIHCYYNNMTGRCIIDDEAIQTTISPVYTTAIGIDESFIPDSEEEFKTLTSGLFYYIMTRKHPSVIISEEAFKIHFRIYNSINSNRIYFFRHNGLVYIYILDEEMHDNFYKIFDIINMSKEDTIRYFIGATIASDNMNNIFMAHDEDEVSSVMEERHNIKDLLMFIEQEFETEYSGHDSSSDDIIDRLRVFNFDTFESKIRSHIEEFISYDEDNEDEDDGDIDNYDDYDIDDEKDEDVSYIEEDDDEINVDDFPDIDELKTNTDDIDQRMEDDEPVENITQNVQVIEKVTTTDSSTKNNMTMPIHRRR